MTKQQERLKALEIKGQLRNALRNLTGAGKHIEIDDKLKGEPEWIEVNIRRQYECLWHIYSAVMDMYKAVDLLTQGEAQEAESK